MNVWKKIGLTASLAAGFGIVGAGAYSLGTSVNQIVEAAENTSETADTDEQSTAALSTTTATNTSHDVDTTETADDSDTLTVQEVAANSMPAMVAITNTSVQEVQSYYGGYGFGMNGNGQTQTVESVSAGTGVIIGETDDTIQIVTNAHVISGATELSVAFVDESAASATVIGSDTDHDLAVIEVQKSDLSEDTLSQIKAITFGSSDDMEIGEQVTAIGNALGYGQSVSTGIISAKDRSITTQDETTGETKQTEGLLQTDAAINPGNSGGALLNMKGELIGINSAKYADESVEGMGYAIPIDMAQPIIESIINGTSADASETSTESTDGVSLGISGTTVTSEYSEYYDIPEGVYVGSVTSGSPAENAGLQEGDVITAIDGQTVSSIDELKEILQNYSSGDSAQLTVSRSASLSSQFGQNRTVYQSGTLTVTFGTASDRTDA